MKPDIVVVSPLPPTVQAVLDNEFTVHRLWEAADPAALLATVAGQVRGIATHGWRGADAALIRALPKLEIISVFGVGYDTVDVSCARDHGVIVTNTPDVLTDDVADLALALLICTLRRVCVADRFVREGRWLQEQFPLARCINGKRLGVMGLGRIGLAIARRAEALGMSIAYHNRRRRDDVPYPYYADLVELAREVDVLVIAAAGGAASRQSVNRAVFEALGPEGTLLNIARGSIVDEAELVAALTDGRLGAAGLDVFADEPRVPEALFALDNVVLQPHIASATVETRAAMGQLMIDNLRAHFAGQRALTPVPETPLPAN